MVHYLDLHDLFRLARVKGHVRLEEQVVLVEVRLRDFRSENHVAFGVLLFNELLDRRRVNRQTTFKQTLDRPFDGRLAHPRGEVKDAQILAARTPWPVGKQFVVGHAEPNAREQVAMPTVVFECSRFTDEAIDHVPVVDPMLALAMQTRQTFGASLGVPDLDVLSENAGRHLLADQPTWHTVGIHLDDNRARTADRRRDRVVEGDRLRGQGTKGFAFFLKTFRSTGVLLLEHLIDKRLVSFSVGEVATATEQERLVDRFLEVSVQALAIAVLVRTSRVRLRRLDMIMEHQPTEPRGEVALR